MGPNLCQGIAADMDNYALTEAIRGRIVPGVQDQVTARPNSCPVYEVLARLARC